MNINFLVTVGCLLILTHFFHFSFFIASQDRNGKDLETLKLYELEINKHQNNEPPMTDTNEPRWNEPYSLACHDEAQMECKSSSGDHTSVRDTLPDVTAFKMKELIITVNPDPEVAPSSHVLEEHEYNTDINEKRNESIESSSSLVASP
jgi:hypothetical protein